MPKVNDQGSTRLFMSNAMEAINDRLKQLEDIEKHLCLGKEATIHRRAEEDEQLQLRRQEEDRDFVETLRERDQEEDELRRRRRIISRSSFSHLAENSRYDESQGPTSIGNRPVTRSKTKVNRSASTTVPCSSLGRKGPPNARDGQGRDLFTRPSDGKLVYLHCCVPGCGRANFPNAMALRKHVSSPAGLHKIKGLITSNAQAIEVCGQEELPAYARDQPFRVTLSGNVTRAGVLPSSPTSSDEYHLPNKTSSWSFSDTEGRSGATLSKTLGPFKAQDFDEVYKTRSLHNGSLMERRTRAEAAAELFDGYMSSDSEDSDEIPANRIDQHEAANRVTNPSTPLQVGATSGREDAKIARDDSESVVLTDDDQAIKNESSASPPLFLEQAKRRPSPKTRVIASEAEPVSRFVTEIKHLESNSRDESIAIRKRANSAPLATPAIIKRLRLTDEDSKR